MGVFNKLKSLFNKIFRKNNNNELDFFEEIKEVKPLPIIEEEESIELPENELVTFADEVLDTDSKVSIEKLKHNLEILMKKAKETGKIDKFMLIREDDFFPTGWEWNVLSKDTNLEKEVTPLSFELRKAYALEQQGIPAYIDLMGIKVPNPDREKVMQALSQVDKSIGSVLMPSRFRSTRHFTVNTPLGVTGDYNMVETNRDYIIIDDINSFLKSDYAYSVSYHDAYLDVSHENLPISQEAVILINDEKYERIMSDEKMANELSQRRVVRFKGDETLAINMVLTEMGVLPSKIGALYANYDQEIYDILDNSIKKLADENDLFFDKSHGGELKPDGGHFSNYYDGKNEDYEEANQEFIAFLRQKFPDNEQLFQVGTRLTESSSMKIVEQLGVDSLLKAIDEYNELANQKLQERLERRKQDRKNITPEVHSQFVETLNLINSFYKSEVNYKSYEERMQVEDTIQKFIQGETVNEQLEAAKSVLKLLPNRTINMQQIVSNAIGKCGISAEQVMQSDNVEIIETKENLMEEEIRND